MPISVSRPWFLIKPYDVTQTPDGRDIAIMAVQTLGPQLYVQAEGSWFHIPDPTALVTVIEPTLADAYANLIRAFPESELIL